MKKIIKLEDRFTTQKQIDSWYNSSINGIAKGMGSIIEDVGINIFRDNYTSFYTQTITSLNGMKKQIYRSALKKNPESYITLDEILKNLL